MVTVGSLAFSVVANSDKLTSGITASRKELRALRDSFLSTQTPVERFSMAIGELEKHAAKFPEKAAIFNRSIAAMRAEIQKLGTTDVFSKLSGATPDDRWGEGMRSLAGQSGDANRRSSDWRSSVRARSAALEQSENLRLRRDFIGAQSPLKPPDPMVAVGFSKIQLVIDPVSLAFRALSKAADVAHFALDKVRQITEAVHERMEALDQISKRARLLGVAEESLVGLAAAAKDLAGIEGDQFDRGLLEFTKGIAEAAMTGKGDAAAAFDRLGLSVKELSRLAPDQALLRTADALSKVKNASERLSLADALLGGKNAPLAQMLAAGADEIERIADRANELQQTKFINFDDIERANDALSEFRQLTDGVLNLLASEFAPLVRDVTGDLTNGFQRAGEEGNRLRDTIQNVARGIASMVDAVENLGKSLSMLTPDAGDGNKQYLMAHINPGAYLELWHNIARGQEGSRTANLEANQFAQPLPFGKEFRQPTAEGIAAAMEESRLRAPGLLEPGNIDLVNRPQVRNEDGTISTVRSMSANIEGIETLLPTVSKFGKILSDAQAINEFRETGQHLGKFSSEEAASNYAELLHKQQEMFFSQPGGIEGKAQTSDELIKEMSAIADRRLRMYAELDKAEKARNAIIEKQVELEHKRGESERRMREEQERKVRGVVDQTRTPVEELIKKFGELNGLPLDDNTRVRALEDLRKQTEETGGFNIANRSIGAVHAGSVEALRARFGPKTLDEKTLIEAKKTATATQQAKDLLGQIKKAIEDIPGFGAKG